MKLMSQEKIAEYKQPDESGRKHTHDTKYHRGKELCWKQIDHQVGCRIQQPQDQTLVLNKRVANDISMIQSEDVKTCFENVQEKLKEHYQTLLAILESEAK